MFFLVYRIQWTFLSGILHLFTFYLWSLAGFIHLLVFSNLREWIHIHTYTHTRIHLHIKGSRVYFMHSRCAFVTFYQQWAMERALNAKPEELMFESNQLRVEKEDENHSQRKKILLSAADLGYFKSTVSPLWYMGAICLLKVETCWLLVSVN